MATIKGGHIESNADPDNYAGVDQAVVTQTGQEAVADWVVTLKDVPTKKNFTKNEDLTYNSKGTNNPNADNALRVTRVDGPTKYICTGNWPINI